MACVPRTTAPSWSCQDSEASAELKLIVMAVMLGTSIVSISSPLIFSHFVHWKPIHSKLLLAIKCLAAGVILSISLVHVLPRSFDSLSDCQVVSLRPWKDLPFTGIVPIIGAVTALLVDIMQSCYGNDKSSHYAPVKTHEDSSDSSSAGKKTVTTQFEMGIMGWHDRQAEEMAKLRQRLVAQVLEIGVVFYPVIIGLMMGVSHNLCTIKALVAALVLHHFFEGIELGGCMAQAGLNFGTTAYMCIVFSVTAPIGMVLGMILYTATGYEPKSAKALIMEGISGSLASGILLYMAFVKFTAAEFFYSKVMMGSRPWMKKLCFFLFVVGCASMTFLIIWV
ncbi:hypothetical protein PVL29_016393 [Vitis rotundifolia]|uniref:Uncharacterized protein n=1 Tax=Vitis rotundifolia TaxID=103349 RepID=A0AA38Z7J6_VITRO|nr:hypothetical protein PVL29_016393 [Vitis rotundifolia]